MSDFGISAYQQQLTSAAATICIWVSAAGLVYFATTSPVIGLKLQIGLMFAGFCFVIWGFSRFF